jgi:hypothetical protein
MNGALIFSVNFNVCYFSLLSSVIENIESVLSMTVQPALNNIRYTLATFGAFSSNDTGHCTPAHYDITVRSYSL